MIKYNLLFMIALVLGVHTRSIAQAPPILLQRCYGGDSTDVINCIRQTSDGGYIAAGQTLSVNGDLAANGGIIGAWVLKLDASANIQWEKTYAGIFYASYVEPTNDGGYIVTGSKTMKLHSDGSIDWQIDQGGSTIHQLSDGSYILCGGGLIVKYKPDGSVDWQQNYDPAGGSSDPEYIALDICPSVTIGYMFTGGFRWDVGGASVYNFKIDDTGGFLPAANELTTHGYGAQILRTFDNNYIVAGYKFTGSYVIAKFDDNCSILWNKVVSSGSFKSVATTTDESYVAAGAISTDVLVNKFDNSGNVVWQKTMGGSSYEYATSIIQATDGAYVLAGATSSNDGDVSGNHGGQDGWVVIFGTNVSVPTTNDPQDNVVIYPTPAVESVNVSLPKALQHATLKLVNTLGQSIQAREDINGNSRVLHLNGLAPGEYLLQIIGDQHCLSKKIIHY